MHEERRQTSREAAHAGTRLKLNDELGRSRLTGQPSSRTGENPPYGMIGGIEETSASFEARYAPRSYPTMLLHFFPDQSRDAELAVTCKRYRSRCVGQPVAVPDGIELEKRAVPDFVPGNVDVVF